MAARTTSRKRSAAAKAAAPSSRRPKAQAAGPPQPEVSVPVESDAESAVRRYLLFLDDPAALADESLQQDLERQLEGERDVMARLAIADRLAREVSPSREALEAEFVRHARSFVRDHPVSADAFARLGVPREVLVAAKLLPGDSRSSRSRRPARQPASDAAAVDAPRTRRVPRSAIEDAMRGSDGPFTIAAIAEATGGSVTGVKLVLNDLQDAGEVAAVGTDESYSGRGRAPMRYQMTGS